jgi:hypothetical protein
METPNMETGRQTRKLPFGDSPFPYGVCDHMGINTYTKLTLLLAKVFFNCSRVQGPTKNKY